ncbi:hypothetical protein [Paenibacillus monticola]|uniref:Butirosin biosynthesis protein H N-terminal domain-containing protein n=1 Tax=Paenibacillus monticola TaxID=2666075 RepID=A0A7X2L579_9BACL|nr:hypothetical protein [Paenibacillus monticola]MRN57279.1 hypothetical protein [Paenibacillus monticola]
MKNCSSLNLITPPIIGRLDVTYPMIAILNHKNGWDWVNNHYVQLWGCDPLAGDMDFNFVHTLKRAPLLDFEIIDSVKSSELIELLIDKIDHEYYAFIELDDYYLPDKAEYHKSPYTHVNFLYGYDRENKLLDTVGFNAQWQYSTMKIKFADALIAYEHSIKKKILFLKTNHNANYKFDVDLLKRQINDFLNSENTALPLNQLHKHLLGKGYLLGINAQKNVKLYFEKFISEKLEYDIRPIHILWEHKKCMRMKLEYLNDNGYLSNPDLTNEFIRLEKSYLDLRSWFLKYDLSKNEKNIGKITSAFNKLIDIEQEALVKLLVEL